MKPVQDMFRFCFEFSENNGIADIAKHPQVQVKRWRNGEDKYRTYAVLRPDGLTEKVWPGVAGDASRGFSVSLQCSINYFPRLDYPPGSFGIYFSLEDLARINSWPISIDPTWHFCGKNEVEIVERLTAFCAAAKAMVRPAIEAAAKKLLSKPLLRKGAELAAQIRDGRQMTEEDIVRELRSLGPEPPLFEDESEEERRKLIETMREIMEQMEPGKKLPTSCELLAIEILNDVKYWASKPSSKP